MNRSSPTTVTRPERSKSNISRRAAALSTVLAAFASVCPVGALAQQTERSISIVVPMSPGTGMDVIARLIGERLQKSFSQPVVVENRSGASGIIGATAVARSAPDGHTLLVTADPPFTANLGLRKEQPYDPATDFVPIVELAVATPVLALHASVPVSSTREFVDYVKGQSGKLSYGTPGVGTPHHLTMELFKLATRIDIGHVPFKDSAGMISALTGGHVVASFVPLHFVLPLPRDKVRLLGLAGSKRVAAAPHLPTLNEEGYSGLEAEIRFGLFAPKGTEPALVLRYNKAVNEILQEPKIAETMSGLGMTPVGGPSDRYAQALRNDIAKWQRVIQGAGIVMK